MARVPKTVWSSGPFTSRLLVAVPISFILHAFLALLAGVGSCGRSKPVDMTVTYVSVVQLPRGNPNAGGSTMKAAPEEVVPTPPPPPEDDSMTLPATPDPAKAAGTPDPNAARKRALEKAAQEKARQEALKRLLAKNDTAHEGTPGAANAENAGNFGVPNGDWSAVPGAVPYEALVRAAIEANWLPPTWGAAGPKRYACLIGIKVGFDGRITERQLVKTSGLTAFDQSALAAVDKTQKLPPPPEEVRDYLLRKGITLRFNPRLQEPGGSP